MDNPNQYTFRTRSSDFSSAKAFINAIFYDITLLVTNLIKHWFPTLLLALWYLFFFEFDQGEDLLIILIETNGFLPFIGVLLSILALSISIWFYLRISLNRVPEEISGMSRSEFTALMRSGGFLELLSTKTIKGSDPHKAEFNAVYPRFIGVLFLFLFGFALLDEYLEFTDKIREQSIIWIFRSNGLALLVFLPALFYFLKLMNYAVVGWMGNRNSRSENRAQLVLLVALTIGLGLFVFWPYLDPIVVEDPFYSKTISMASLSHIAGVVCAYFLTMRTWVARNSSPGMHALGFHLILFPLLCIFSLFFIVLNFINLDFFPIHAVSLGLAFWLLILTILRALKRTGHLQKEFRVFYTMLIAMLLISNIVGTDYHAIRLTDVNENKIERKRVDEHFIHWVHTRKNQINNGYPVYLIMGEGGGNRAALWSSYIYFSINAETAGDFHRHTYAVSTASGSSTGMASAMSILSSYPAGDSIDWNSWKAFPERMFRSNFLNHSLINLVGQDLWNNIIPLGTAGIFTSRNIRLENKWARVYSDLVSEIDPDQKIRKLDNSFLSIWYDDQQMRYDLPIFTPNTTIVESGQRAFISPVQLSSRQSERIDFFRYLDDSTEHSASQLMTGSAALISASFPYINASSGVDEFAHFADGGYYDNRGSGTGEMILQCMLSVINGNADTVEQGMDQPTKTKFRELRRDSVFRKLRIKLVYLLNSEPNTGFFHNDRIIQASVPITTLEGTYGARTRAAYEDMQLISRSDSIISLYTLSLIHGRDSTIMEPIDPDRVKHAPRIPLGRYLSESSVDKIKANYRYQRNREVVDRIIKDLKR